MTDLSVSVAIATYNGARYLPEQLQSIFAQTRVPEEVVICDDGSSDETEAVVGSLKAAAPCPIRFERNSERLGYAGNFRRAASLCEGDIIAFCDQDDWWAPRKIERAIVPFESSDVQLVYHNARIVTSAREPIGLLYNADQEGAALAIRPIAPWHHSYGLVQLFRASLRRFDDLWDMSVNHIVQKHDPLSHDQWYFFLAQTLGRVVFLDEVLVDYRQHGTNAVGAIQKRPAAGARAWKRLEHYGWTDDKAAESARARGSIMRHLEGRGAASPERLQLLARHYDLLASRLSRRAAVYRDAGILPRFKHLLASWRAGDYSDWPWGFDRRSVLRDLISGVMLHKYDEPAPVTPSKH